MSAESQELKDKLVSLVTVHLDGDKTLRDDELVPETIELVNRLIDEGGIALVIGQCVAWVAASAVVASAIVNDLAGPTNVTPEKVWAIVQDIERKKNT